MDYTYEQNLIEQGYKYVCGIDEAGRGSLAGPLVAGAVILNPHKIEILEEVKDSKKLSAEKRIEIFKLIKENALTWSVGAVSAAEIDKHGLSFANKIAMKRAWQYLAVKPNYILSDYMAKLYFETPFRLITKGDNKVISIAAASIVAKVIRDNMMMAFAKRFPEYSFEDHKGYGTQLHRDKITELGPCEIHRKSFEPIKAKLF